MLLANGRSPPFPTTVTPLDPAFAFPTTSPASDHAVVMGEITHSGGEENVVDLFWGDNDGNQTLSNWDSKSSRKPTYTVSNSLLNNKSSVSSSSENGSIGLDLPSTSLQEIFVVAYYKDGSDNSFDNYNTLISGTGTNGQYRIMGHSGSSNWFTGSDRLNDGGNFKNGATSSSNSALPMSATLLRFASSVARTQTRGILYNTQNADRGWIGGVGQIIGLSTTSSTSDRQKIEGYLATPLGTGKEGFYGTTISGLTAGETYHYRLRSQGKLNPKGISGSNLNLWLDAADSSTLTLYSGKVSTWSDKSGNDNHATQSNSDYQPTLNNSVLNALPVIRFDGSNDVMTLSGDHALQTFFLVLNARDGNNFGDWDWPMGGWTSSGNKKWVIFANAHNNSISGENASINGGTPSSAYARN